MTEKNDAHERRDFRQTVYDDELRADLRDLMKLAIREDSETAGDITSRALIPANAHAATAMIANPPPRTNADMANIL